MTKFKALKRTNLTNGQHIAFMTDFVTCLAKISDPPAKMRAAIAALERATEEEGRHVKAEWDKILTERICEADSDRDNSYRKLRSLVKTWQGSGIEPQSAAAEALQRLLDAYNINPTAQMDQETGLMDSLLEDLDTPQARQHLADIDAQPLADSMRQSNALFAALLSERDRHDSTVTSGAMRKSRLAADKAYAAVVEAVEAYDYVLGGYADFITEWNATVTRYREILTRKADC